MGFADDVREGLTDDPKWLLPKYFYDARGSALYEEITQLEAYYLPRVETGILRAHAREMVEAAGPPEGIVELGSGSASKTRILIETLLELRDEASYHPLDISRSAVRYTEKVLAQDYPDLTVEGFVGEYRDALLEVEAGTVPPRMFVFLGSSIGNLDPDESVELLRNVCRAMTPGEGFLLGTDMVKSEEVLIPAYDDPRGVTAEFNKNLLHRINRELDGEFAPGAFEHLAEWNPDEERVEIHLVSRRDQEVRIGDLDLVVEFEAGERIHTENSQKYTPERVEAMARDADLDLERSWYDDDRWFGLHLLRRRVGAHTDADGPEPP